jgi:hypothetical protein
MFACDVVPAYIAAGYQDRYGESDYPRHSPSEIAHNRERVLPSAAAHEMSVLRTFDLPAIAPCFAEYPSEIGRRLDPTG